MLKKSVRILRKKRIFLLTTVFSLKMKNLIILSWHDKSILEYMNFTKYQHERNWKCLELDVQVCVYILLFVPVHLWTV